MSDNISTCKPCMLCNAKVQFNFKKLLFVQFYCKHFDLNDFILMIPMTHDNMHN